MSASRRFDTTSGDAFLDRALAENPQLRGRALPEFMKHLQFKTVEKGKKWIFTVPPEPEKKPEQEETNTHRNRVKSHAYVSPSRRGLVPVTTHVPPELRKALHEKFRQSSCDSFNEFMTSLLQRTIDNTAEHDTSAKLTEAVEHTRALQKTISDLALDLSSRRPR